MCRFYLLGVCSRGAGCKFAHHKGELNPLPDLSRTKICKSLLHRGICEDASYRYAHDTSEIRALPEGAGCPGAVGAYSEAPALGVLGPVQPVQLCWAYQQMPPAPWPAEAAGMVLLAPAAGAPQGALGHFPSYQVSDRAPDVEQAPQATGGAAAWLSRTAAARDECPGMVVKNTFLEFEDGQDASPIVSALRPVRTCSGRLDLMG